MEQEEGAGAALLRRSWAQLMQSEGEHVAVSAVVERARNRARTQLWPLPTAGIVVAAVLGVALPRLDASIDDSLPPSVTAYLFGGGASAARSVLSAVAGSLITVTSLTFSLTVVTLQLASSQFSPRLLRTFNRDRFVHVTLALFLGTFTYALMVLRTIRDRTEALDLFVPQVAVTVALALALASVIGLVLFLAHLARQIRIETMLRSVHRDASATVQRVLKEPEDGSSRARQEPTSARAAEPLPLPVPGPGAVPLLSARSGFLLEIDEQALLASARESDAIVRFERYPGSSLVRGTPMGVVWPRTGEPFDGKTAERLQDSVSAAVLIGFERTESQDIGYGLRQLTDVTNKALSPGINDPTTAVYALGHTSALLCELVSHDLGARVLHDEDDRVRVVLPRPSLADLLEIGVGQPRRYGASDPLVLGRLFSLLRELAWTIHTLAGQGPGTGQEQGAGHVARQIADQRQAVAEQLSRLRKTAQEQDLDDAEQVALAGLARLVDRALVGSWPIAGTA